MNCFLKDTAQYHVQFGGLIHSQGHSLALINQPSSKAKRFSVCGWLSVHGSQGMPSLVALSGLLPKFVVSRSLKTHKFF